MKPFHLAPVFSLALIFVPAVYGHDFIEKSVAKTSIDIGMSATWRSDGAAEDREAWRIPGALMGGESWPVERDLILDEANLTLTHHIDENVYGVIKAATHSGGGDHSGVALEHVYLGWRGTDSVSGLTLEAGRMSAVFSPAVTEHASTRLFSEAPLVLDVFLGRHFHDEGVRAIWQPASGVSVGAEYWRGNNFPATAIADGGSADIFARYDWQGERLLVQAGAWWMQADAELRSDHRYGGGHQHNDPFTTLIPDVRFSGESRLGGVNGKLRWQFSDTVAWGVQGEWMQLEAEGQLMDAVRTAAIESDYAGGWLQSSFYWKRHTLSLRAEELLLENFLSGNGAPQLAIDAGLANDGENPHRLTVSWHWQWYDHIGLRLEAVKDESMLRDNSRVALGFVWRESLWSR